MREMRLDAMTPADKIQKRAKNSISGRKAQAAGDKFETWIEAHHNRALERGVLAHVMHNEPKTKYVNGKLIKDKPSAADYTGMFDGGSAKYFAAEAKSTTEKYLPLEALTKKQQDHMEAVARGNGIALLLIEFRIEVVSTHGTGVHIRRYAVPWLAVPWKVKISARSVDEADISTWLITTDCYLQRYYVGGVRSSLAGGPRRRMYPVE